MLAPIAKFNKTIWLVILSTFAGRFVLFMIWPFLAILLHTRFGLNTFEIGLFLAVATCSGTAFGFYVGFLSDRIGRRKIILIGLCVSITGMVLLGLADTLWVFFAGTILQSLSRDMIEDPGRALMTDMVDEREVKDMAIHMRYFGLNIGAATGPILGAYAGTTGEQSTFFVLALVYLAYFCAAAVVFSLERPLKRTASPKLKLGEVANILGKDRAFLLVVLATTLSSMAYGQTESGLIQYLQLAAVPDLAWLFALLILVNGVTVVVLQFPTLYLLRRTPLLNRAMYGVLFFALGFLGFAFVPTEPSLGLIVSIFVLSIGEVILFPTLNVVVDRMAKPEVKGSYFGAASLSTFGFGLAPFVGGTLLFMTGGLGLWLGMVCVALVVAGLYFWASRLSEAL